MTKRGVGGRAAAIAAPPRSARLRDEGRAGPLTPPRSPSSDRHNSYRRPDPHPPTLTRGGPTNGVRSPPSVRGEREVPIEVLYVSPTFSAAGTPLPLEDVVAQAHRLVVLGQPGAGKSTFARHLCLEVASGAAGVAGGQGLLLFVELRTYARETSSQRLNFTDWITRDISSTYGLLAPERGIEQLLSTGRLGVVFDGLDELPAVSRRREIRDAVESFGRRFPLAPIIVTSRLVGYEYASLAEPFQDVRLLDFSQTQIRDYVSRSFSYQQARDKSTERAGDAEAFLHESSIATDLRTNPLLLGLMCVLYRGQGYIPRNRPDLYGQCTTYLFETWDKHRGVEIVWPVQDLLRPALRHLASWIYGSPELQDGVTHDEAVRRTAQFLAGQRFSDAIRAEAVARDFIDFCRGRAWVFSDVGADVTGRDLFHFTHRTFLEFYAAEQLLNDLQLLDRICGCSLGSDRFSARWVFLTSQPQT